VLFAQSQVYVLSLALLIPVAFALMIQASATNAFIQNHCEEEMRGRVMAFFAMATQGTVPISALIMAGWPTALARLGRWPWVGRDVSSRLYSPAGAASCARARDAH